MNILLFSPVLLMPELYSGARIRIYNIGKYFQSLGHTVHFVYYADNGMDDKSFEFLQNEWDTFTLIEQKSVPQMHTGNYKLDERYEPHIADTIDTLVSKFSIDIVWCNYIFQSAFLDTLPGHIYKIIDTHDVFTDRYKLFEDHGEVAYIWYSYSNKDEQASLQRADMIVAITEEEKAYFEQLVETKVTTIGHFETPKYLTKQYTSLQKVGFIGGANDVNVVSINHFLEQFYQRSRYADRIEIDIAGYVCEGITVKQPTLTLLGPVETVETFYQTVDLVINPLTFGTGQKIKTVEALSYGLPLLSTSIGFEGIEGDSPYHHLNSIDKMITQLDKLIESESSLSELSEESRIVFDAYYENITQKLYALLQHIPVRTETATINPGDLETYRLKSKETWLTILFNFQKNTIEQQEQHILKQANWIKVQEKQLDEQNQKILKQANWIRQQDKIITSWKRIQVFLDQLINTSFRRAPLKKIKLIKSLLDEYIYRRSR